MISQTGVMTRSKKRKKCFSLWLIGPSGSGKTVVSKILYKKLSIFYDNLIILDGDIARKIFINVSGFDRASRTKNIYQYIAMSSWLSSYGISTIVSVINAFEKDRKFGRNKIKNYKEVYLKCSLDERIKRDKKKLYLPAIKGKKKNVIDVDIPFEKPSNSNLILDSEKNKPKDLAKVIIKKLKLIK